MKHAENEGCASGAQQAHEHFDRSAGGAGPAKRWRKKPVVVVDLHDLANRWDAPDARFALLDASVRAVLQQCARELRAALAEREESEAPPSAQCAITSALATLVRASHDVDELDDGVREIWRELAVEARREYDGLRARVAELEQRAEKAEANYRFMVERAADEKLDGYRELGQRAAAAEQRAERAEAEVAKLRFELERAVIDRDAAESRARQYLTDDKEDLERAEARVAELEDENKGITNLNALVVRKLQAAEDRIVARVADLAEDLEQRAERAEAEVAKLRDQVETWRIRSNAHQQAAEAAELGAKAAEARVAELERELDAAQEHIHAGDECITSLHDDLARVADLVRKAHGHWDAIRWPEDKLYIAMLAEAIEVLTVGGRDALNEPDPVATALAALGEAAVAVWLEPYSSERAGELRFAIDAYGRARKGER